MTTKKKEKAEAEQFQKVDDLLSYLIRNLKAPKSQHNKFGNYKYRNAEDILEAVKKLLPEGAVLNISDEVQLIGDRYYIKATAKLMYKEVHLESSAFAREEENKKGMDSAQVTGSTSSYARKYALNGLFCIDDTKDADHDSQHEDATKTQKTTAKKAEPKPAEKKPTEGDGIPEEEFNELLNGIVNCDCPKELDELKGKLTAAKPRMTGKQAKQLGSNLIAREKWFADSLESKMDQANMDKVA